MITDHAGHLAHVSVVEETAYDAEIGEDGMVAVRTGSKEFMESVEGSELLVCDDCGEEIEVTGAELIWD